MEPLLPHLNHQRPVDAVQPTQQVRPQAKLNGPSFGEYMEEQIGRVNDMQIKKNQAMEALATGETDNIGEVMTAVKKAEVAFTMMMEVRNKLQEAYQDVMRMQV